MGRKKKSTVADTLPKARNIEKATAMFKDWMEGMSMPDIAAKHDMALANVRDYAIRYKWGALRSEIVTRSFAVAMDEMASLTVGMIGALKKDFKGILEACQKENRLLNTDERHHIRSMTDRFLKERRIDKGEIPADSGTVRVELVMPPGVKHAGVIPVSQSNIRVVSQEEADAEDVIDLESIKD
jgi:hypothetical protein